MTDLMLDELLALSREDEPMDDRFVQSVMTEIHAHEQRNWRLKLVRRPIVFGVATAVLATSGAVAALVGTHVTPKHVAAPPSATAAHASVTVSARPSLAGLPAPSAVVPSASAAGAEAAPTGHVGLPSLHTAWIIDDVSGLKLTTETYGNDFAVGKAQKVTLTLLNTTQNPLLVSGMTKCALQVDATHLGGPDAAPQCASGGVSNDTVVLAPGGFYTATAEVVLPSAGKWNIVGRCVCNYSDTQSTIGTKANPFGSLLNKTAPEPLLPTKSAPAKGTARLATPAIGVKASS